MSLGPAPVDRDEIALRLGLLATPGLTQYRVSQLLSAHDGSGRAAYDALESTFGADVAAAARSDVVRRRVRRVLAALREQQIAVIASGDPRYPSTFSENVGVGEPPLLFARGRLELLAAQKRSVAVVGCRAASEYGLDVAEQIGGGVARAGGCVVSGVALGIDAAAHQAALDAGGDTIGILGCGVDVYYPRSNMTLQDRIANDGLLLSELLPGEPPRRHQFPERNRLIAALAEVVVVVEAGAKSGALTTAGHASVQGVGVCGVPNAVHLPNMQGVLALYRDGVSVYTGVQDLLMAAGLIGLGDVAPAEPEHEPPPEAVHRRIWNALAAEPVHVDALATAVSLPVSDVIGLLLELELDGRVVQVPGQRFTRARQSRRTSGVVSGAGA